MRAAVVGKFAGERESGLLAAGELNAVAEVRPQQRRDLREVVVQRAVDVARRRRWRVFRLVPVAVACNVLDWIWNWSNARRSVDDW